MASPTFEKSGHAGIAGTWITLQAAKDYAGGVEWWNHVSCDGYTIPPTQCDESGPKEKPVWYFENGDMYLGGWTKENGHRKETGYGITFIKNPPEYEGMVYMGEFKDGLAHGKGESFWLENAPAWIQNEHPPSPIVDSNEKRLPYKYYGLRVNDVEQDLNALVVLKDGTTRVGKWEGV